ncbi:retrovirus-related pol polyprotein from transposon TNT 1-94 [Tanacetum coccineum]
MKVLNVGTTEGSCDQQALESDRIQLQDTITSLRIQLDGLKVENVSLKRRYDELSKANTHSRTAYTAKLSALTTQHTKLQAQVTGVKPTSGASKTVPKRALGIIVSFARLEQCLGACNKSLVFPIDTDCLVMCDGSVNVKPHQTKRIQFSMVSGYLEAQTDDLYRMAYGDYKPAFMSQIRNNDMVDHTQRFMDNQPVLHSLNDMIHFTSLLAYEKPLPEVMSEDLTHAKYDKDHMCPSESASTRFGWVRFLRTKDETPQVIEKFIVKTQRALITVSLSVKQIIIEFVNKTLDGWFESVGISHETSVPRSPQQNGVVERRNRTLMEATRTMLIFAKAPLFLWAEAVATATFRVFGSLCYPTNDYDDVGKLKAKADIEGAPAVTESLLPHQIPLPDTSDSDVETLFDHVDSNVFDTYNAPETNSEASSSNSVNIDVTPNNQLPHVQKGGLKQHPALKTLLGIKIDLSLPGNN